MKQTLRLILGDQLHAAHSWFANVDPQVTYVLMEVRQETDYAAHHLQKVVAFFLAMRSFADTLRRVGHHVVYFTLDDPDNLQGIGENLLRLLATGKFTHFEYQEPDEYRLDQQLAAFAQSLKIPAHRVSSEHFLSQRTDLKEMFTGKKTYLMETFYRAMRKQYRILLEDSGEPIGGKWNYDADNRKPYDKRQPVPPVAAFPKEVGPLVDMIRASGVKTIGSLAHFTWPVTRAEALQALDHFIQHALPFFGAYQDAMAKSEWALFHSLLSFPMNVKLIHPLEVVNRVVAAWKSRPDEIPLSAAEGFIRQVIGWREYMRGVYWANMPGYATLNYFDHNRPLPAYFWTADTRMQCMQKAIGQSLTHGYAHHIQRLMVTGNFALLAGIHPDEVDAWYLGIYLDALEWVQITNTRGMSQFADGGLVGSKPYVSSANYIDKMGDYCQGCFYDKKKRHGYRACPFNSLYWHFYDRNEALLARNPRIGYAYQTLKKMNPEEKAATLHQAEVYLSNIENL